VLTSILLLARYLTVLTASAKNSLLKENRKMLTLMFPRGLAAAILAQMVVSSNAPYAIFYSDIVITVIIASVLISSIGSFLMKSEENKNE
jgi:NhaP-type Na+/H+ or K+/H+ antiporter